MHASQLEPVRPLAGGGGAASVTLVRAEGRDWVLKKHRARDIGAERLFNTTLHTHGLPALAVADCEGLGPDEIVLEFVEGSPTVGGAFDLALCRRWGAAIRALHGIQFDDLLTLDDDARPQPSTWRDFAASLTERTIARQRRLQTDLPGSLLDLAARRLEPLLGFSPTRFVLTHGDLHANNALVRNDAIVLFDKPADIWSAPVMFDLCLILSEAFPGAHYGANRPGDAERLAAFLDGYGPLGADETPWLDHFVLLRSLRRYPNPFVPEMRAIIELALSRLG